MPPLKPLGTPINTSYSSTLADREHDTRGVLDLAILSATTSTFTAETTILTVVVDVAENRQIRISSEGQVMSSVAADDAGIELKEGATYLTNSGTANEIRYGSGTAAAPFHRSILLTPTAGRHTYTLTVRRYLGTGNISVAGGGNGYTYLLVEDLGPVRA